MPHSFTATVDAVEERVLVLIQRYTELQDSHQKMQSQVDELETERLRLQSCLSAARARIESLIDRLPAEIAELARGPAPDSSANRPAEPA